MTLQVASLFWACATLERAFSGVAASGIQLFEIKGTVLGTPNREPQEYSRYIIGIYLPGSLYSVIFLLYSWGSLFGVPSRVPLQMAASDNAKEYLALSIGSTAPGS